MEEDEFARKAALALTVCKRDWAWSCKVECFSLNLFSAGGLGARFKMPSLAYTGTLEPMLKKASDLFLRKTRILNRGEYG